MHRNADQEAKKRRTQLRLAQRAYRSRKEDELRTLKTRVHELEMLVERINKTFISFTDDLMKSGVLLTYPDVARKLHQTIEQSLSLANKAISVVEDDADASSAETHVPETKASADVVASSMEQVVASANDIFNIADILLPKIPGFAAGGQRNDSSQNPVQDPVQTTSQRSNLVVPKIPTEATLLPSTLPLLHTPSSSMYSLEGATFAHRLYRACAEQGYHCLRNPSSQLEVLTYKFRLPLKLFTRHNIMAYFEEYLSHRHHRKFTEVNIPFMSIGGAGTHFKHNHRSYIIDNASFQPNTIQVGIEQVDPDMRGDWFDCYDVEGYLEKCRIVPIRRRALAERLTFPAALPGLEYGLRNHRISGPNTFQQFGNQKIIDETILIECKPLGWPNQSSESTNFFQANLHG
jgi:hypothetical protein